MISTQRLFDYRQRQAHFGYRLPKAIMAVAALSLMTAGAQVARAQDKDLPTPFLPEQVHPVSTVPSNGDLNPYGVAFVPSGFPSGTVNPGDILVSNFNNKKNLQGTGTTIIDVPAGTGGSVSVFFQGKGLLGLSTALNILRKGFVLVGNFPSHDGTCQSARNGSILVINSSGQEVSAIADPLFINGPWDSALYDQGNKAKFFVANGLTGTVVRLDLIVSSTGVTLDGETVIASGYLHQCDPVTFVDAPTGLVYDPSLDVLYVASTADNTVFAVSGAGSATTDNGRGRVVYESRNRLHGPLGMIMAPNGDLIVSNNDVINPDPMQPSELVEFTTTGQFVKEISVDANFGGSFGLAVETKGNIAHFAAVDDNVSILLDWQFPQP
jgi:DNA-binding beta-propeller fold protein YncE